MEDQVPQSERRSRARKRAPGKTTPSTPGGGGDGKAPIEPVDGSPNPGNSRTIDVESGAAPLAERRPPGTLAEEGGWEKEFDVLASENPRAVVFGALGIGIAVGFVLGRIVSKD